MRKGNSTIGSDGSIKINSTGSLVIQSSNKGFAASALLAGVDRNLALTEVARPKDSYFIALTAPIEPEIKAFRDRPSLAGYLEGRVSFQGAAPTDSFPIESIDFSANSVITILERITTSQEATVITEITMSDPAIVRATKPEILNSPHIEGGSTFHVQLLLAPPHVDGTTSVELDTLGALLKSM